MSHMFLNPVEKHFLKLGLPTQWNEHVERSFQSVRVSVRSSRGSGDRPVAQTEAKQFGIQPLAKRDATRPVRFFKVLK